MKTLVAKISRGYLVTLLLVAVATTCSAQYRNNRNESSFRFVYQDSETINFKGGSTVQLENDVGIGFELGFNKDSRLNFSWSVDYVRPRYKATLAPADESSRAINYRGRMEFLDMQFNATYYFLDGPFTPYIKTGLGFNHIDTNIAKGPPQGGCWWDPWWGYICDYYQRTYADWRFGYNVGAGVRWDINQDMYMKANVTEEWLNLSRSVGSPSITKASLEFGIFF